MSDGVTLITGAGGYLGRLLVRHYLDHTDQELVLGARTPWRGDEALDPRRARCVPVDLEEPEPFAAIDGELRGRITAIVHLAAITRFNVERARAQKVNVDGTAHTLALAARCPGLESFAHVSTVYATGLRAGSVREEPYDDAGFANNYEWSKWAAEGLVAGADLPLRVLRVSTVVADDDSGFVTQYNAFHTTLKLCFYGLLGLVPGSAGTPLYLTTGRFVVGAIARLVGSSDAGGFYHLTHDRAGALSLGQLLDIVFEEFGSDPEFAKKGIVRPLLADQESFGWLVEAASPVAGSLVAQALAEVEPFSGQLYVNKSVENSRLRDALGLDAWPEMDMAELVARTCRHLVRTRWGRR
jgi:nucleoside-diphosphate-sugar epimerase